MVPYILKPISHTHTHTLVFNPYTVLYVCILVAKDTHTHTHSNPHKSPSPSPAASLTICRGTGRLLFKHSSSFFFLAVSSPPVFVVIMTSRCFNFRFAYPLPLLPHLHTARMAGGHPTDKFSFMYQPDTHKRYGARMHTLTRKQHTHTTQHTHAPSPPRPGKSLRCILLSVLRGGVSGSDAGHLHPSPVPPRSTDREATRHLTGPTRTCALLSALGPPLIPRAHLTARCHGACILIKSPFSFRCMLAKSFSWIVALRIESLGFMCDDE